MTYDEALDYLNALGPRGWRLGLDRMQEFVRRADLSSALGDGSPRYIHVAGTNGKGSVTAYLQSMLVESGYWTGAFFSPYVYEPRERIQFNRELIPEKVFAMLVQLLRPAAESLEETEFGGITKFEFETGLGLAFWRHLECEWVALEVGLGGRLDATNVVTPAASVIVSISLDHTNILGTTIEEIAFEKAGIIKPGVPVVVGEMPAPALTVIERVAADKEAAIWRFGREIHLTDGFSVSTPAGEHRGLEPGIKGARQAHNMALAVAAMDASGSGRTLRAYEDGALRASAPGRYEKRVVGGQLFILDGAHNADAARALRSSLDSDTSLAGRRVAIVTCMVAGHDPREFYVELADRVSVAHIAPIDFARALSVSEVAAALRPLVSETFEHSAIPEAIRAAILDAGPDGVVLVTGSFYLVGAVGNLLSNGGS